MDDQNSRQGRNGFVDHAESGLRKTLDIAQKGRTAIAVGGFLGTGGIIAITAIIGISIFTAFVVGDTGTGEAAGIPGRESGQTPASSSGSAAACIRPTSGLCSPSNLLTYTDKFGNNIDAASIICQAESRGDPGPVNDHCILPTTNPKSSDDYSVGLFQINLIGLCTEAFSCYQLDPRKGASCRNSSGQTTWCTIKDSSILEGCKNTYIDNKKNTETAVSLSNYGNSWSLWGTAACVGH